MKVSRRSALKTCSAVSASAVMATATAANTSPLSAKTIARQTQDELVRCLTAAIADSQTLQESSRQSAKVNARWNFLATQAGNCQRIATVILNQLNADRHASAANVQACADSCGQLILTTHVLSDAETEIEAALASLTACKQACLKWLSLNLA
ncbi:MAG: hypothetical protein ABJZ55_07915 [Fuerstiella sp.]